MNKRNLSYKIKKKLKLLNVQRCIVFGLIGFCSLAIILCLFWTYKTISNTQTVKLDTAAPEEASDLEPADTPKEILVHVSGCVVNSNVYAIEEGARVLDAIELAGGFTEDAARDFLNLAEKLHDGQHLVVPSIEELNSDTSPFAEVASANNSTNKIININTASADLLDSLPGVGPSTASAIIKNREENGPFASIEDIMRVSGIGESKYSQLKDLICV